MCVHAHACVHACVCLCSMEALQIIKTMLKNKYIIKKTLTTTRHRKEKQKHESAYLGSEITDDY